MANQAERDTLFNMMVSLSNMHQTNVLARIFGAMERNDNHFAILEEHILNIYEVERSK